METVVLIFLVTLFLVGVIRIVVFLRGGTPLLMEPGQPVGKRSHAILGFFNIASSIGGFALLKLTAEDSVNILIGLALTLLIYEVAFRKTSII